MVLAGGTLAATACSASNSGGALDAGSDTTEGPDSPGVCCNANADPCCPSMQCGEAVSPMCRAEMDCQADGGVWTEGVGCSMPSEMCCNANPDPCCPSLYCGAAVSLPCMAEMECQADGGTWMMSPYGCSLPDAGGPRDAATGDAPGDASDAAEPEAGHD